MTTGNVWIFRASLGLVGLLIGLLSLTGAFGQAVEFGLWTLAAVAIWVPLVLARRDPRPILALAFAGLVAGILTGAVQAAWADALLANNEGYAASMGDDATAAVRMTLLASAIGVGVAWGALWGCVAWGVRKWRGGEHAPNDATG